VLLGSAAPVVSDTQRGRRNRRLGDTTGDSAMDCCCSASTGPDVYSGSVKVYFSHCPFVVRKSPCCACLK
jgi:hypothetical protein